MEEIMKFMTKVKIINTMLMVLVAVLTIGGTFSFRTGSLWIWIQMFIYTVVDLIHYLLREK